jgi:hypothetical protein
MFIKASQLQGVVVLGQAALSLAGVSNPRPHNTLHADPRGALRSRYRGSQGGVQGWQEVIARGDERGSVEVGTAQESAHSVG